MRDKPQRGSPPLFDLRDHHVIELRGRDAAAFAQAQFMNDVAALARDHWQWSGWLSPKGRVIALFALIKLDEERLWLLVADAAPAPLVAALQRFVFRSKLAIIVRDDIRASGAFASPLSAAGNRVTTQGAEVELDVGGAGGPRRLVIAPVRAEQHAEDTARWDAFDLEHGLPRLRDSQVEQWTPQQLSLDRLGAYSIRKGCYPGQEIVARTHFLGKAKRGLLLVEAGLALAPGAQLRLASNASPLGVLVSCASTAGGRHLALAVAPLERDPGTMLVDGVEVREIPLRDGLVR